jgi:mannose-6-phosphate isomerase-like protein (cupin superfamily)
MRTAIFGVTALTALSVVAAQEYQPTCRMCPGTYIAKSEIDAYVKRAIANGLTDQQVRAVDIGKSNLGVGVVYRGKLANPEASVAEHDLVSEVYHIIEGRATLVLGADLVGKQRRPATLKTVRLQNGPGNGAKAMRDGVAYDLGPGDVVVIPAGTGHQFTKVDDRIVYLMVRVDPDKIVPLKTEADSKADLQTTGDETPEEAKAAGAKAAHLGKEYEPTCKMCPGTYIPNSEITAYVKRAIANQLVDQQVRQVDIGKVNVGVAVVHRGRLAKAEANVAEHDLVSELYHVIDGTATLKLGPDLVGKERRPAAATTVRLLNGPGNNARDIRNGVSYEIKPGDVVIIPAGTGHQFTRIDDHITYLMVRVDPDKVTPHKTEADSKADLQTDGRTTASGGAGSLGPASATKPTPR